MMEDSTLVNPFSQPCGLCELMRSSQGCVSYLHRIVVYQIDPSLYLVVVKLAHGKRKTINKNKPLFS